MKKDSLYEKNPSNFKTYCDLESGTFEKGFLCTSDRLGAIFTLINVFPFQKNLKSYSGKPDISFKCNSDKNIILKRENLET